MTTQEMVNQANEIMKIRENYEKWIGMQIQNYCNQNGLDYNNAKDYSMAAIKLQKITRPLSPYDAGLLYRILDCQKTDETSSPTIEAITLLHIFQTKTGIPLNQCTANGKSLKEASRTSSTTPMR